MKFTTDIRAMYSPQNYCECKEVRTKMPPSVHSRRSHVCTFDTLRGTENKRFVDRTVKRIYMYTMFIHHLPFPTSSALAWAMASQAAWRRSHARTHVPISSPSFIIKLHVSPNSIIKIGTFIQQNSIKGVGNDCKGHTEQYSYIFRVYICTSQLW